jgi:hypothetical protein
MIRASATGLPAVVAALLAAAPAAAQDIDSLCRFVPSSEGEPAIGGKTNCQVRWETGGLSAVLNLHRTDMEACGSLDEHRRVHPAGHPTARYVDLDYLSAGRGYERYAPRWAYEETRADGGTTVHIHPGTFEVAACVPPYMFWTTVSIYAYGSDVIPEAVVDELRERARETAARLGGAVGRTDGDAERDLVAALGPEVTAALEDLAARGLLERDDAIDLVSERSRDPQVVATGRRLSEALRGRPMAVLTDAERTAVTTLAGVAVLASVMDRNGEPAFPAAAANLGVLTELGVRAATDPDPARAHLAATAMARYAAMLRDLDVKALEDRHGAGGGETPS